MEFYRSQGTLAQFLSDTPWPVDFFSPDDLQDILDAVYVVDYSITTSEAGLSAMFWFAFEGELAVPLPGVEGVKLVAGGDTPEYTFVTVGLEIGQPSQLTLHRVSFALRFDPDLLRPMRQITDATGGIGFEADNSRRHVQIELGSVDVSVDSTGKFDLTGEFEMELPCPVRIGETDIIIPSGSVFFDFSDDEKCVAFKWTETNLRGLLRRLSPALNDQGTPAQSEMALRVILGDPIREIRLDWTFEQQGDNRSFSLPGLKVETPAKPTYTVLLGGEDKSLSNLAFILTLEKDDDISVRSTFAWGRDEDRELQNDEEAEEDKPLFEVAFCPKTKVSMVLLEFDLTDFALPRLFQQLEHPLTALDPTNADTICTPTALNARSLRAQDWEGELQLGLDKFELPFLKEKASDPSQNQFAQLIKLDTSALKGGAPIPLNFEEKTIEFPVGAEITLGPLQFETEIEFKFNWETFSLDVDHDGGIDLISREAKFEPTKEHLGLKWRFVGKLEERDVIDRNGTLGTEKVYHFFTLVTKNYDYQIQQAEDSRIEIEYTRASDEPIVFAVTDFKVTPKGISLAADVTDRPARLNGIDTRFRFHGTRIEIVENRIQDFTLAGSGPLPPALVGEAMADIALQFSQREGSLTLVAGRAQLKGNKLLDCKGTRFQFSVDALGLRFVNDGKFHLYFTLTGSAQFVLAPGDDREGALALLPNIKIDMVECPLTGDMSVIGKHVKFLIELPSPKSFNFLGCFEMELRGIGFLPQAEEFGGDGAMEVTGQLKFAHGPGDTPDSRVDYHRLLIGLPAEGDIFPRIYFKHLPVNLNFGAAFKLNGVVEFVDGELEKGFSGEGVLQIQGLPTLAASFAFLRVRRDPESAWVRAWFIYLEVRRVSFMIPVVQIYLREVGLGFGYRFTLVSIKTADRANDVRKLLEELRKLSRTQGDLSKRDRWEVDLEEPGEDARWTIVLRALLAQTSGAPSPLQWKKESEKDLSCAFLFDAVIAFRSDLTFFMAARGWINTNYFNYDKNTDELKTKPLVSGFVLLSPRQKRFLAHVASNPEGYIGDNPPLPGLVKEAIKSVRFSATLLIEPGLFHFELGWPNMLIWKTKLGPLKIENRGGFIFRVSETELVLGVSYLARGSLNIEASIDLKIVGVRVSASAELAYGGRLISLIKKEGFWIYGGIGLEMRIQISIEFWIRIPLIFTSIKLSYRFSVGIGFTAGLEVGITSSGLGLRGRGTISLSAMGHSFHFSASFAFGEGAVESALMETQKYLNLGLEATDVEALPGLNGALLETGGSGSGALEVESASRSVSRPGPSFATAATETGPSTTLEAAVSDGEFHAPGYSIFVIREPDQDGWSYSVLLPQGEDRDTGKPEAGFLPAPPLSLSVKLVFWGDLLDKGQIPTQFKSEIEQRDGWVLSGDAQVSVEAFGTRWLITDQSETGGRRYRLEVTDQVLTAVKTEHMRFDIDTSDLETGGYFVARLKAFPGGPLERYLAVLKYFFQWWRHGQDLDAFFFTTLRTAFREQADIELSGSLTVQYIAGGWILSDQGPDPDQQYRMRLSGNILYVWEILQVEQEVFSIERDRQSYQLNRGQIPQEVESEFDGDYTVSPADDGWLITETDPGQQIFKVQRLIDRLEINLEIVNDFTLHIPNVALFSVALDFVDTLDSGSVSESLKGEFSNHDIVLTAPDVSAVTPGSEWLIVDPEAPAEGEVQFQYPIRKVSEPGGSERLAVYGGLVLEQFAPLADGAAQGWVDHTAKVNTGGETSWQVNWQAQIFDAEEVTEYEVDAANAQLRDTEPQGRALTLANYLKHAFELQEFSSNGASDGDEATYQVIPVGDPDVDMIYQDDKAPIEDGRVYNPTDSAFEAAVRGAVEQFEGSPFFKKDPNYEYDIILDGAFQTNATIYHQDGEVPADPAERQKAHNTEQAVQLRGMVIHDLVADVRDHAHAQLEKLVDKSIPFQMGLVFRFKGKRPPWLDEVCEDNEEQKPFIQQRLGPKMSVPADDSKPASTFNVIQTDFSLNPPHFQRVQQLTDADTIALTWDLVWPDIPTDGWSKCQAEPEHHLAHYEVLRRALDGSERDVIYTVKSAQVLHREVKKNQDKQVIKAALKRLKPRFQVVDHFTSETLSDIADLPATGRSYLYTITPVDFEGNLGRPLTLIATRRPNLPPLVPVDGELVVRHRLKQDDLLPENAAAPVAPQVVVPDKVLVEWTEPIASRQAPQVPVAKHRLIFRKEPTLPIGSYGLDSTTQGPRAKALPTTNARPLPTDIKIELEAEAEAPETARRGRRAEISIETLRQAGVFPGEGMGWRPESWRVFFQTVSVNNVPSALAPVQLLLRIEMQPDDLQDEELQDRREERRPAELEWLAYPIKFDLLAPEDQNATLGNAHFPMPSLEPELPDEQFKFLGNLTHVEYRGHPAGIRCLRFRWNQGPSHVMDYPLDLNAGYEILELDIDAHTTATFENRARLAEALRNIQEVQMLPAEDLLLTPGDTLVTNQWEAWYPSAMLRLRSKEQLEEQGGEIPFRPWYSWRESYLEWPDDTGFIVSGERQQALHPILQAIIDRLAQTFTVDLQISPPIQPNTFGTFMDSTAPKSDPYGWGILQRFGLSVAFSLHDRNTGALVLGGELLSQIKQALDDVTADAELQVSDSLPHLFVELLFQPGRSIELKEYTVPESALLAIAQVSLRPIPKQYLGYSKIKVRGAAQRPVDVFIDLKEPASFINQADPASGQTELTPEADKVRRRVILPLSGETALLFRSKTVPDVQIGLVLPSDPVHQNELAEFSEAVTYEDSAEPKRLIIHQAYNDLTDDDRWAICKALFDIDRQTIVDTADATHREMCELLLALSFDPLEPFAATDELSTYFVVPQDLAEAFEEGGALWEQWDRFRRYAQALNSADQGVDQIEIPTEKGEIRKTLVDFLNWSQRFFAACGAPSIDETTKQASMEAGPWMATAYPRAGSPAYATPDENGRLKYDHLLEDKWAHNYRYYIRPYGRYDLLWQSFRRSPSLFPSGARAVEKLPLALPDPESGGLDVVVDRTHPVDKPLILSSRRLDRPSRPGQPVPPGPIWEVMVAQHAEQSLIERNQTLARQLGFRHIAFTLLRRFTYGDWIKQLKVWYADLEIGYVDDRYPAIPDAYPDVPDHIDLDQEQLPVEVERSLALPERLGTFQQGAMALQWDALPFYYTHRLLVVAQTASNVSPINQVTQQDFEYRSPLAWGVVQGVDQQRGEPPGTIRIRVAEIPLRPFWDSLPEAAQQQWPSEAPGQQGSKRKFSSLPDPEVVYQVVEIFGGNVEVQVEVFFDQGEKKYAPRQLGKTFTTEEGWLEVIPPETPQGDFLLALGLLQSTEEKLTGHYDIPGDKQFKLRMDGEILRVFGVFTQEDRDLMLGFDLPDEDAKVIESLYQGWFSREPVSEAKDLSGLPEELKKLVDFVAATETTLVWEGTLTAEERQALLDLPGDRVFKEALTRLANAAASAREQDITIEKAPLGPAHLDLPQQMTLTFDDATNTYTAINWTGLLFDDDVPSLKGQVQIPELVEAVDCLLNKLEDITIAKDITPPRPLPEELPDVIQGRLLIGDDNLVWTETAPSDAERAGLDSVLGDEAFGDAAFRTALTGLVGEIDQPYTVTLPRCVDIPDIADLPEAIRSKLQINLGGDSLAWPGPAPSDAERAGLETVIANTELDPRFVDGVRTLLDAIDADRTVELPKELAEDDIPAPEDLPELIRGRLQINVGARELVWLGPAPSDEERAALNDVVEDATFHPQFIEAMRRLLGAIDASQTVTLPRCVDIPDIADLPEAIRSKLQINLGEDSLAWPGPAPSDAERAGLETVIASAELNPKFVDGVRTLLDAIDAEKTVPMPVLGPRPRQPDLPELLQAQLTIEPTRIQWQGRVRSQEQFDALAGLISDDGDPDFNTVIQEIVDQLENATVECPLDIPLRPESKDLPEILKDKLLIANVLIRYHGLMTVTEGQAIQALFELRTEKQAIQRLFTSSINRGMRGRELRLRTRRGSAAVSQSQLFASKPLNSR